MSIYEGVISDKMAVVIDIGEAYTKVGFSGEFSPRCIIPSVVKCKDTQTLRKLRDFQDQTDLYDLLVDFIDFIYFKYAILSPKDRPVVVVESLLCTTLFRETLAKVLFCHYEISKLLIVSSHLVSLAPLAIDTALVLDVGYSESCVIPVCHGLPLIYAWQALPLGAEVVHSNLRNLLAPSYTGISTLPETIIEDIKVRCCFVTTLVRAKEYTNSSSPIPVCSGVKYSVEDGKTLIVPGKVRETAYEILFEEDNDHQCIATMILDAILKVNLDLRVRLAENILVIGGTAMAPGFKSRLKQELHKQLKSNRYNKLKLTQFKFHSAPCYDNYTAWLGGAIYGATELLSLKGLTREVYLRENRLPDWANLRDNVKSL